MNTVPFSFAGALAAMAGLSWIIGRRIKNQGGNPGDRE
jgi:hypothetical protein